MNELSQEALYNLIYSAIDFGDSLFELWLTVTFAGILAVYFSSARITAFMRWLLMSLYAVTSIMLTGRWLVAMLHYATYLESIESEGFTPFPTPVWARAFFLLHLATFVLGSIATVYFMWTFGRSSEEQHSQDA